MGIHHQCFCWVSEIQCGLGQYRHLRFEFNDFEMLVSQNYHTFGFTASNNNGIKVRRDNPPMQVPLFQPSMHSIYYLRFIVAVLCEFEMVKYRDM
jgi:hypothetical protein